MTERINNHYSDSERLKNQDLEERILKRSSALKVPPGLSKQEALLRVKSKISSGNTGFRVKRNLGKSRYLYSSVAASLLVLFGIWRLWIYNPETEINVAKAVHTEYNLPDGSLVKINSDSKISFKNDDFMKNRRLKLDGEAYFEIAKGDDFIISTRLAEIKILGTTFNVFSRGDEFKVSCLTGRIMVSNKNESVTISPGESATIKDNRLIYFEDKNINTSNSWTAGDFNFENAPLNLIFGELERQFNVKFELTNVGEKYFTGSFSNIDLNAALETICQPMGLKYEIGGKDKIFITEKKP